MAADVPPLLDVRELLPLDTPPGAHLLRRPMRYYHYGLGHSDHGWGCGYRTVQTILSWLSAEPAPPISTLQGTLKRTHAFSGERGWIGVPDAVIILDELHGCQAKIISLASGAEAGAHLSELAAHFDADGGPVMVGGGGDVYSKTVVGVSTSPPGALLILDPHYAGTASLNIRPQPLEAGLDVPDTSRQALWSGGWIAWRPLSVLRHDSFYNLALPLALQPTDQPSSATRTEAAQAAGGGGCDATDWGSLIEVVGEG